MVETTPAGLFSAKNRYDWVATVSPSTLTSSLSGSTRRPCSVTIRAVDLDAALLDQLLAGAARAHTGPGQHLLQPLALLLGAGEGLGQVQLRLARAARGCAPRSAASTRGGGPGPAAAAGCPLGRLACRPWYAACRRGFVRPDWPRGADVVAALLGAGLAPARRWASSPRPRPSPRRSGRHAWVAAHRPGGSALPPLFLSLLRIKCPSVVCVLSGASGSNDGRPSWDSASTASASGRNGASSGSSSRPRRPIRSRK